LKSTSPTIFKSKTGVPLLAKKWKPRIGNDPRPGMLKGALGTRDLVRGCWAAMAEIWLEVEGERKARGVTS